MQMKRIWERTLPWWLVLWIAAAFIIKPGWVIFSAGCLIWLAILYLSARGVFWYWAYTCNLSPFKSDAALQKSVADRPFIPGPYFTAGILAAKKKQWNDAITYLEKAADLYGKKVPPQLNIILSVAFREKGDTAKSLDILNRLEASGHRDMMLYLNFATLHYRTGDYPAALEAAAKARSLNVNATEPVLTAAKAKFAAGDYQAAKDDYEWVLPRLRWPVETYYWLGRARLELGEIPSAVADLKKAAERIESDPDLSDVSLDEARRWLVKAEESLPQRTDSSEENNPA